ncbi:hypothetical protein GCM10011594_43030 [Nakamurella endophytica]|uniref:Uncharacterized protein n=1 Tax=Nakamurella endophytica TaxID=1748367 RepID=A0A917TCM2_9ACTN|nr:hypothetical protein GCM10011594_43030 [Nakamurella endophytica]
MPAPDPSSGRAAVSIAPPSTDPHGGTPANHTRVIPLRMVSRRPAPIQFIRPGGPACRPVAAGCGATAPGDVPRAGAAPDTAVPARATESVDPAADRRADRYPQDSGPP